MPPSPKSPMLEYASSMKIHVRVIKAPIVYKQEIMIPPTYTLRPLPASYLSAPPSICLINPYLGPITNNTIPDNATSHRLKDQKIHKKRFTIYVMS